MKVVILAGGFGTRISEESHLKPKPMIEIGGKPILWHIMKIYSYYGFNDFIICLGYKGYYVKEYFAHYFLHEATVTFDFRMDMQIVHDNRVEPWQVTLVDTGLETMTGGRVKRVQEYVGNETFMLTYGDGVCNVNIEKLLEYHKSHGKLLTITAVQPAGRFGSLVLSENNKVSEFREKLHGDGGYVNGGFIVCEPGIFDYIADDSTVLESHTFEHLASIGELMAYCHTGYWQPMDTLRDKNTLELLWNAGKAPWKIW